MSDVPSLAKYERIRPIASGSEAASSVRRDDRRRFAADVREAEAM